jgi:hypothetical protein
MILSLATVLMGTLVAILVNDHTSFGGPEFNIEEDAEN